MPRDNESDEPAADASSDDGPWGFKRFPVMERDMAIKAAKRAKVTVPDYVAEAIRGHVESERDDAHDFALFPPTAAGTELVVRQPSVSPLSVAEIGEAVEIAERIASLRGRAVPARLLSSAMRALSARINGVV